MRDNLLKDELNVLCLDCLGDACPIPMLKLQEAMKKLQTGEQLLLVSDSSCTAKVITEYCSAKGYSLRIHEAITGVWEFRIQKSPKNK